MSKTYPVSLSGVQIGTAIVTKEGLYAAIECRCKFSKEGFYRIRLHIGQVIMDLGTCIPKDGHYSVKTRVPFKDIQDQKIAFSVYDPGEREILWESGGLRLPVSKLSRAKRETYGGIVRLVTDQSEGLRDNGQNP